MNKESVVIPQYLFDELIEYFDNKSDADGNIPNKEMKLLSQLQEEHSIKENGNNKTIPKEILDAIDEKISQECAPKTQEWALRRRFAIFGYSLRESSSNSTDELRKEVERLKGLIKQLWIATHNEVMTNSQLESRWQQFSKINLIVS